jgi:PKD repeat protein
VTIDANSEGEALDGLRLCSAPPGVNDCSQPQAQGVLLDGALKVAARDVTLRGLTFTGKAPGLEALEPVAATHNHWEAYKLSQVKARVTGPAASEVSVVPFLDRDARTPILPPQAGFEPSLTTTDRLTPVTFTDATAVGTRPLEAWTWAFGDGALGDGATASHTYAALGDFTARLTVRDEAELTSTASRVLRVVNLPPKAVYAFGPDPANRAEPTVFTDASLDRDGTVAAWLWTLPDGTTSTASEVSYTFERLGQFPVTLEVTDNDGDTDTTTRIVSVVNLAPTASFTWGPDVPMLLQPVQFDDLSSDAEGNLQAWLWDFGDGITSQEPEPVHPYATGGWHRVTLTVTDADGEARSLAQDLYVCAPGVGDAEALLSLEHFHLEFEACIRVTDIPWPL